MKLSDISKEELETMNYDDIAYIILKEEKKLMKINILFKKVCDALELNEKEFEAHIADFFGLLTTDKRFLMLEDGSWDLKEIHNPKVIIDDDEEENIMNDVEETEEEINEEEETNEDDIFYDADSEDDIADDDLDDFMIINEDDEEANS